MPNGPLFKTYSPGQLMLLPPDLGELIADNHPVRVVNQIIDQLDIEAILSKYRGGGTTSYHPRMLLKLWVYGYMTNIFSSRKLAIALHENIHFMWLSGQQKPDHNTLNRFRSGKLVDDFKLIFMQVVQLLANEGLLDLKTVYVDGTKMEANANRYTFVWRKNLERYIKDIGQQLEDLWAYTQAQAKEEAEHLDLDEMKELSPEKLSEIAQKISSQLTHQQVETAKKKEHQKQKDKARRLAKEGPGRLAKYQKLIIDMGERNSLSKTDVDATFMRMKEDHYHNSQLKPSYNIQVSASNQFIAHFSLHQTANDHATLTEHLDQIKDLYGSYPQQVVGDAGYGSEQNYVHAERHQYAPYLKYPSFNRERKGTLLKQNPYHQQTFTYDPEKDEYTCPKGRQAPLHTVNTKTTKGGLEQTIHQYKVKDCANCSLLGKCHSGQSSRTLNVNYNLKRLKDEVYKNLVSKQGTELCKQRSAQVETVFGDIKQNSGFRRVSLRGYHKGEAEIGWIAMAYNLKKWVKAVA